MNEELISVIVPIYKVEKYLKRCIESIINQTYHNLEIILVDDGSPDKCGEMCEEYSKKDKRIKVIHKENGGLSDARNKGLEIATGKYIGFVDSDDFIDKDMYKVLYNNLKNNNADMSICSIYQFENEEEIVKGYNKNETVITYNKQEMFNNFYDDLLRNVVAWNKLYKADIFKDIKYPKGKAVEDTAVIHYIIDKCNKVVISNLQLYFYLQRDESIIHQVNANLLDELDFIYDKSKFLEKKGYQNEKIYNDNIEYYVYKNIDLYTLLLSNGVKKPKTFSIHRKNLKVLIKQYKYKSIKQKAKFKLYIFSPSLYYIMVQMKRRICDIKSTLFIRKSNQKLKKAYRQYCKKNHKKHIIFNAPNHGNLGDHAILFAEEKILKDNQMNPFSVISHDTEYFLSTLADSINKDDIIFITGGGNFGTIWEHEQLRANTVIENLKDNKIIVFPQTIYYDDDRHGLYAIKRDYNLYKKCKDITLCCRDKKSFDFVCKYFIGIKTIYVPDIATYLDNIISEEYNRKNICFCFREDVEKSLNNEEKNTIIQFLKDKYKEDSIKKINTVPSSKPGAYDLKKGKKELLELLKQIKKSKLLITDRLHGMIFAVITNTPCIAFANKSGKVKGVYNWISKDNDYVKFANSVEQFKQILEDLDLTKKYYYKNEELKKELLKIIGEELDGKD